MNNLTQYGSYRYFLVPYDTIQMSLLDNKLPNRKVLIENILINTETSIKIQDNNYDGKYKLYLLNKINNDNYLLQLGKHSSIKQSQDTGNGFEESNIDNYPYIHIIINTKEQIVLFEKKTKAFKDYSTAAKAFSLYMTERIDNLGYEFKFEEISLPSHFWNIVDNATELNSITLTLYSPNLFDGETPAEDAARDLESATNSTENILTFRNKHGKLSLIKDKLKTFIEYISGGGGSWSINARIPHKRDKNFSSKTNVKTLYLPNDIANMSKEALEQIIPHNIQSINHKPGDDNNNGEKIKD